MITIYHVAGTRSMRIIWLCAELDIPLNVETIDFSPEYRSGEEWRSKSPTGKVPAMEVDGLVMFESGAMVDYILERYGNGRLQPPAGSHDSALYRQWCWFAEATLARPLGDMVQHLRLKPEAERIPAMVKDGEVRARTCLAAVDAAVKDTAYLVANEFTAADIMMGYSLKLAEGLGVLDDSYPNLNRYFAALKDRPGYQQALD